MERIVYVNGEFYPQSEAKISVFDRGFIFGDGVYEVVPVINSKLVDKQYFLERLNRSLTELSIDWPCSQDQYIEVMEKLISANQLTEGVVYSQVTRGIAERDFPFPKDAAPSLVAFTTVMALLDNPAARTGIPVITTEDLRWKRRDIKSINLLGQCLAKEDAVSQGGAEGWMVEDGLVTEGVSSTAYIIKNNLIITRELSNSILPGIRRRTMLEIAKENNLDFEERAFSVDEALSADEAFISSATTLAMPVVSIDGKPVASGVPGPITMRLRELYKNKLIAEAAAA
ncbi:MAG TPA: D-amino acid aminotransferase [Gammaproteobacteria bacterium]|nr:D-amino acid aminotransferase [Gammaproteobacteria bacterium]